ncbi:MAG: hypothetical protein HKM89_10655 [Gemmatimonadales bacterium]|nr:hypothetical protein [Gemmatimonadales bacterium]
MSGAVELERDFDHTDVPLILRASFRLGIIQAILVLAFSLVSRFLDGSLAFVLQAFIILVGLTATCALPGLWTKARHTEGIAGAAGIGLGATVVFMIADVAILQWIGTYTNRWLEIGGGSNWWYHPVWWMAGTFLAWMGATVLANQAAKGRQPSVVGLMFLALGFTLVAGVLANLVGLPGAAWSLPTFAVAFLPGIALAALFSAIGRRRA